MSSLNAIRKQFERISKPLNGTIGALTVNMGKIYNTASAMGMSLPYLSEPSSGQMQTYTRVQDSEQPAISAAEMAQRVKDAMYAGMLAQDRAQRDIGKFDGSVSFSDVQHAWNPTTGNPIYMKGLARAQIGADIFDLPNVVAQQAQYRASYNQGAWDPGNMFGKRMIGEGMIGNYDVAKQKMAKFNLDNPELFGQGALDPYREAQSRVAQATNNLSALKNRTEKVDSQGGIIGADVMAQRKAELEDANRQLSSANKFAYGYGGRYATDAMLKATQFVEDNVKPTVSNLVIKENLIK